jgi:Organic solute transporter Ostalpha
VGGVFVLMALPISLWDITQHVAHESAPHLQRHVVRILWMVPIYAMNAWISLVLPAASVYLDSLRECYEAYVIYNFMRFLLNFLEHQQPPPEMALRDKTQVSTQYLFYLTKFQLHNKYSLLFTPPPHLFK